MEYFVKVINNKILYVDFLQALKKEIVNFVTV